MPAKFTNNASAPLAASINSSSASITVTTSYGAFFPSLGAGEYFYATLTNSSNAIEIVKVTARSGDTLTAVRGQEGTTALSWAAADKIELRITAADLANFAQFDSANTFIGANTFSGAVALPAAPTFGGGVLGVLYGGTGASTAAAFAAVIGNLLFPVGSIYTATVSTNPNALLGFGTWVAFGAGRVLVGVGTNAGVTYAAGSTSGSKDAVVIAHAHSVSSISTSTVNLDHSHAYNDTGSFAGGAGAGGAVVQGNSDNRYTSGMSANATHSHTLTGNTDTSGVAGTNLNMQPYIVVYMWQRTA